MKVTYLNNDGGGYAHEVELDEGTTVSDFFNREIGGGADNYLIRVNRQNVNSGQVLNEGDRVTVTPTKIEGA